MNSHSQHLLFASTNDVFSFDNYYGSANKLVKEKLISFLENDDALFAYIYGEKGVGKTHLLKACIARAELSRSKNAFNAYLHFHQLNNDTVNSIRDSLEPLLVRGNGANESKPNVLIIIDDVQELKAASSSNSEVAETELALLSLYEVLRNFHSKLQAGEAENSHNTGASIKLICASNKPPKQISFQHKDLATRLSTAIIYSLVHIDDIEKQYIFTTIANNQGLKINAKVVDYIFTHYSRDLINLRQLINQLDTLSMQAQRQITVPLVKQAIAQISA